MSFSRRLVLALPLAFLARRGSTAVAAEPGAAPAAVVERFYAVLLAVMKEAKRLPFDERYNRLAPTIGQIFDLGLMTRVADGPGCGQIAPQQQLRITAAMARYMILVYGMLLDEWSGESYEELGLAACLIGTVVNTHLIKCKR